MFSKIGAVELRALLGTAIKNARAVRGISQEELAHRAGLHRTYISDVERGARNPSIESVAKLARALELSVSTLFEQSSSGNGTKQIVQILLVEDDARDVDLTVRAFKKANITNPLHIARDGEEALTFVFANAHEINLPSRLLVLLDLNLPKKSGIDVLRTIKANEQTKEIPVVILTVSDRTRDIAECRRLGAAHYIVKPVGFQNFSEVTSHLRLGWTLVKPPEENERAA
jgi:CheY-like chemotaxis protein/DNA-binding phage protein